MNKKNNLSRNKLYKSNKKIYQFTPFIFIIVVVPLITYGKIIEIPAEVEGLWIGKMAQVDFFNYYKYLALMIGMVATLLVYLGMVLSKQVSLSSDYKYYVPMLLYSFFAIFSTIMSRSKYVAINGFADMYQGIFVLLSYITLTFIVINFIRDERDVRILLYSFSILTIIEGLIGLGQYLGADFFQTSIGQLMILPSKLKESKIDFTFGLYTIYGTMYNSNFIGSFAAIVLPLSIVSYLYYDNTNFSIICGIVSIFAFILWIGCNSRAGYLGILVSLIIGVIIFRKIILKKYKKLLILLFIYFSIYILLNVISNGKVVNQFVRLNPTYEAEKVNNAKEYIRIEEISSKDSSFTIKTNEEVLILKVENNNLIFEDEEGNTLNTFRYNGAIGFEDEAFSEYTFNFNSVNPSIIQASIYGKRLDLYINDNGIYVISMNGKLVKPVKAERFSFFDGKETFASNRGYIWSRSIPLIKHTIIYGFGPDNFPLVFPQYDYVGRLNVGDSGMANVVVDKPHNMYLQSAINTGVLSLLSLLVIWFIYLCDSLGIYIKKDISSFLDYIGAAVFLSIIAYLVAGLFNDSVISVAPLFWILLGIGIGINNMTRIKS